MVAVAILVAAFDLVKTSNLGSGDLQDRSLFIRTEVRGNHPARKTLHLLPIAR
jgi:hypothetical protein